MSPARIPSLAKKASNRWTASVPVGWARSSRRAASAFMTTALIGWLISPIDAESFARNATRFADADSVCGMALTPEQKGGATFWIHADSQNLSEAAKSGRPKLLQARPF